IEYGDRHSQASTYHQLGRVAQELREFEQARRHYQQALSIYIEYGDRYSQAGTYHQLGMVAEELGEYEEAKTNYLQALQIYIEFQDSHNLGIVARSIAHLYQTTKDESILTAAAPILGVTVEELKELLAG
ncbi:MAG: tetratricopeptide repeat protein, partial [Xenococcaceae cyanobacterium]